MLLNLTGRLTVESMNLKQALRGLHIGLTQSLQQPLHGHLGLGSEPLFTLCRFAQLGGELAQALPGTRQQPALLGIEFFMQPRSRQQLLCHDRQARLLALLLLPGPLLQQTLIGGLFGARQQWRNALHHPALMPPAAREGVEHEHVAHHAVKALRRLLPAPQILLRLSGRGVAADLVEQHDDRLVQPGQYVHLGAPVAGIGRVFCRVDKVEHHIRMVARGEQGTLAQVKRLVAPPIPDIAEKPAQRIALLPQALIEPHGVAETRCVPKPQLITLLRFLKQIAL